MDFLTHSISWYFLKKFCYDIDSKKILILFVLWALFPDIDVLWSFNNYNLHRVITHSFILIPIITLFPAFIFYYFYKKEVRFYIIYMIFIFGILSHIFLDTLLVWWTPLFWPISDKYYSFNLYTYVLEPLFFPIYVYFLLYYLGIIKKITNLSVKIMLFSMLLVITLKFSLNIYASSITEIPNNISIWIINKPIDLIIYRYYNSIWHNEWKIKWEIIDIYKWNIIEKYEKDLYEDKNNVCSSLHNWYLFIENWLVGDIRYTQILKDDGNCFYGMKVK